MSETETPTGRAGRIVKDQAILDLSHLTGPGQLAVISRIEDVAVVIVPESLAAAYATIPTATWPRPCTCRAGRTSGCRPGR